MPDGVEQWCVWRAAGLRGRRRADLPEAAVLEAIERHRENAARGREACEQWGPGSSVSRVRIATAGGGELDLAVKWNHPRGWRRGLSERIRGSRASRAERGARELARAGLDHPPTVAVADRVRHGRVWESFLLADFLPDALPLPAAMPALMGDRRRRRAVARSLGRTIGRLHAAGLDHRDLKHSNLLLRGDDRFALLDLDSLIPPRAPDLRARARALGQLEAYCADLYPELPRTDRARFLAAYLDEVPDWRERRRELVDAALAWARRRLEEWSRRDRSDHYHFPMGPRQEPGRPA
jgi:tRNA A-37 threonylcarbamoyl transferase component Bud32